MILKSFFVSPLVDGIVEEYLRTAQVAKQQIKLLLDHLEATPTQRHRLEQLFAIAVVVRLDALSLLGVQLFELAVVLVLDRAEPVQRVELGCLVQKLKDVGKTCESPYVKVFKAIKKVWNVE